MADPGGLLGGRSGGTAVARARNSADCDTTLAGGQEAHYAAEFEAAAAALKTATVFLRGGDDSGDRSEPLPPPQPPPK
ncbi:hypothetical protein [Salinibacter altiplanensis]|uniref:hypothetical protein n=1 Tax=Salinibacter altiplanensis TaxID=1803181 RepID=UPI00131A5CFB|nr:hypothetical protein [Salinibacter altiplanensis]